MRRFIATTLALCLVFTASCAEEEVSKSVWHSIGGWFGQTLEDTSGWATQTWSDASKWAEGDWGNASKWVEQAWNDSPKWITEIWGDVSSWAAETYESASGTIGAWWAETFNTVTESSDNPWEWLTEQSSGLQPEIRDILSDIKEAVITTGSNAESKVKTVFTAILEKLKLNREESQKVWDTIASYADQKDVPRLTAAKLSLPYLLQLTIDSAELQENIPAVAIAQYLTAVLEKLNIHSTAAANELVEQLNNVLSAL